MLEFLVGYLRIELTGQKQYMLHAAYCRRWGYPRLAARQAAYALEEVQHAARILDRILLLGGIAELTDVVEVVSGGGVPAQLHRDRRLVRRAIAHLTAAIAACQQTDEGSRMLLDEMLVDEEEHLAWLDEQLGLLDALGAEIYLQASMRHHA